MSFFCAHELCIEGGVSFASAGSRTTHQGKHDLAVHGDCFRKHGDAGACAACVKNCVKLSALHDCSLPREVVAPDLFVCIHTCDAGSALCSRERARSQHFEHSKRLHSSCHESCPGATHALKVRFFLFFSLVFFECVLEGCCSEAICQATSRSC